MRWTLRLKNINEEFIDQSEKISLIFLSLASILIGFFFSHHVVEFKLVPNVTHF